MALLARLIRHPVWVAGLLANGLGFAIHAAALHVGDISVIQAVLVAQLLFALPFATLRTGGSLLVRDWAATVAVCAGIAVLVVARADQSAPAAGGSPYLVALAGALVIALLLTAARLVTGRAQLHTALLGLAAGTGFSITATFIVVVTRQMARFGPWGGLVDWPTVGLALSGLTAAILVQRAYASGSFPAALTSMTVADPIASWIWSAVFLGSPNDVGLTLTAWYAASGLFLTGGVALLAYSPTLYDERPAGPKQSSLDVEAAAGALPDGSFPDKPLPDKPLADNASLDRVAPSATATGDPERDHCSPGARLP
jgi:hypothetical protein